MAAPRHHAPPWTAPSGPPPRPNPQPTGSTHPLEARAPSFSAVSRLSEANRAAPPTSERHGHLRFTAVAPPLLSTNRDEVYIKGYNELGHIFLDPFGFKPEPPDAGAAPSPFPCRAPLLLTEGRRREPNLQETSCLFLYSARSLNHYTLSPFNLPCRPLKSTDN